MRLGYISLAFTTEKVPWTAKSQKRGRPEEVDVEVSNGGWMYLGGALFRSAERKNKSKEKKKKSEEQFFDHFFLNPTTKPTTQRGVKCHQV